MNIFEIEKSFNAIAEDIDTARTSFQAVTYDDEVDLTEDVALPALMALSGLTALMGELREAGADLAEVPVEDEALVLVIANGELIQRGISAEVAHLESVMARFGS